MRASQIHRIAQGLAQHVTNTDLVSRVCIRMDEADCYSFDFFFADPFGDFSNLRIIKRGVYCAVGTQSLRYFIAMATLYQLLRLFVAQVVEHGHSQTTDFNDVSEALGGHQCCASPFPFKNGVRGHGSGVNQLGNLPSVRADRTQQRLKPRYDRKTIVMGCR
ncbi:hypothetical protein D3C80_1322250 [compost metagenome]